MATENLKFIVEADLSGVGSSIQQLITAINNLTSAVQKNGTSFANATPVIKTASAAISGFTSAANTASTATGKIVMSSEQWRQRAAQLGVDTNNLTAITKSYTTSQQKTTTGFLGIYGGAIRAQYALSGIERAFNGNGIQGYVFGLQQTAREFGDLVAMQGSVSGAFGAISKVLLGPAGIVFGIGFLAEVISKFFRGANQADEITKKFQKDLGQLKNSVLDGSDAFRKSQDNTDKQEEALKILYNTATNVNKSMAERIDAATKLQQLFPQTFDNLTKEQIISGEAASAYKALAANILHVAQAEANFQTILENDKTKNKILDNLSKMSPEYHALAQNVAQAQKAIDDYNKSNGSASASTLAGGANATGGTTFALLQYNLNHAKAALKAYGDQMNQEAAVYKQLDDNNNRLAADTNVLNLTLKDLGDKTKGSQKHVKTLDDLLKSYQANVRAANTQVGLFGYTQENAFSDSQKALKNYIKEVAKDFPQMKKYIQDLLNLYNSNAAKEFPINKLLSAPSQAGAAIQQGTSTLFGINSNGAVGSGKGFGIPNDKEGFNLLGGNNDQMKQQISNMKEWIKDTNHQERAVRMLGSAFNQMFEAIINGQNVFKVLQKFIEDLIVKMATLVAEAAVFSVLSIATGGSLSFLGALGKLTGLPFGGSHASGGYIPMPQLAVIGDAPGGEWVLNQGQMNAILSGAQRNINIPSQIILVARGEDLVATVNTTVKRIDRRN